VGIDNAALFARKEQDRREGKRDAGNIAGAHRLSKHEHADS